MANREERECDITTTVQISLQGYAYTVVHYTLDRSTSALAYLSILGTRAVLSGAPAGALYGKHEAII